MQQEQEYDIFNDKKRILVISRWQELPKGFSKIMKDIYSTFVLQKDYFIMHYAWHRPTTIEDKPEEHNIITISDTSENRLLNLIENVQPEIILCVGDIFNIQKHNLSLSSWTGIKVAYIFVDGENIPVTWKKTLTNFDVVVSATEFGKQELLKSEFIENITINSALKNINNPIRVINPPLDKSFFQYKDNNYRNKLRANKHINKDSFVISNISINATRKGIEQTLELFKYIQQNNPYKNIIPKLILHTNINNSLQNAINYFNFDSCPDGSNPIFLSNMEDSAKSENIRNIYYLSDVLINTSISEGWGLPLTEAMSCGTPVLAPKHSGCIEAVGYNSLNSKPANSELENYFLANIIANNEYLYNTEDIIIGHKPDLNNMFLKIKNLMEIKNFNKILEQNKIKNLLNSRTSKIDKNIIAAEWKTLFDELCNKVYLEKRITQPLSLKIPKSNFYRM